MHRLMVTKIGDELRIVIPGEMQDCMTIWADWP